MDDVVWWEIETHDPERFQKFHGALSDWTFRPAFSDTDVGADYWIIELDGRGFGGLQRACSASLSSSDSPRLYFSVPDLERTLGQVVELGGVVVRERVSLGGDDKWFGIYRDPTGVSFGLWTAHPLRLT